VLGRAIGNTDTQDSPRPGFGGSHHLPPYSILCSSPQRLHPNCYFSRDSWVGVPKSRQMRLLWFWSPITLRVDLQLRWSLKQSYSSRWELFNDMWHAPCSQVNRVDSWLFVVGSQTGNSTLDPSFGHNLCFRCPNEQHKPILDIYAPRVFNDIKNATRHWGLTPAIALWNFESPPGLHLSKWELLWECEGSFPHTPSHFLTLSGVCGMTPGLLLALIPGLLFALLLGFFLARNLTTPLPWSRAQS
jgi:hypothetical protein